MPRPVRRRASAVAPATNTWTRRSDRWPRRARAWPEGFELAEDDLIEAAQTARAWVNPFSPEVEARDTTFDYSEADHEASSEFLDSDK